MKFEKLIIKLLNYCIDQTINLSVKKEDELFPMSEEEKSGQIAAYIDVAGIIIEELMIEDPAILEDPASH